MSKIKMLEICYECGRSVKAGSGWFVNRVPSGDSYEENVDAGRPFPKGEWLCAECDEKIFDTEDEGEDHETDKIYEEVFNILSRNYTENISDTGEGEFIIDDEQRENLMNELVAYIINLK